MLISRTRSFFRHGSSIVPPANRSCYRRKPVIDRPLPLLRRGAAGQRITVADGTSTGGQSTSVGDAPFPLRLVYTYRSPNVSLRRGGKPYAPRWVLTLLLGANAGVFCAWNWVPADQDEEALLRADTTFRGVLDWKPEQTAPHDAHMDFMNRNFTCSVQNLVEGRLHTLITPGFSHKDIWHLTGNMFGLILFGYRSCAALGPTAFLGLYLAGEFAASSAHVMHNLYHGRTAPRLTSAELRGTLRNALRCVSTENAESQVGTRSWLPFGATRAFAADDTPLEAAQASLLESNSDREREVGVLERIGNFMAETGGRVVGAIQGRSNDNDERAAADDDNERSKRDIAGGSSDDFDRRLEEIESESKHLAEEAAQERQKEREASEGLSKERNDQHWWQQWRQQRRKRAEEEVKRRQMALLEAASKLVHHCYVVPRDMPSLGASGSVMAISNGSVLLFPRDLVVRMGVNLSLPASAALYTFSDLVGVVYANPVDHVDHMGHLAGAGMGLLYVWYRWTTRVGIRTPLPILAHWRSWLRS